MSVAPTELASCRQQTIHDSVDTAAPDWFSRLGLPLAPRECAAIAAMLGALGYSPDTAIVVVIDWSDAATVLRGQEWDSRWWDLEEAERERLWCAAGDQMLDAVLLDRLAAISNVHEHPIREGAARAGARDGVIDSGLVRAAADAAALAAHQCGLSTLAAVQAEHYFQHKFELFSAGRWPLGVVAGSFLVF